MTKHDLSQHYSSLREKSMTCMPKTRKPTFNMSKGKVSFRSGSESAGDLTLSARQHYIPTLIRFKPKLTRKDLNKDHFNNASYHMDKVTKHMRAPKT